MIHQNFRIFFVILCLSIFSCSTTEKETARKTITGSNFFISIYDSDITNPEDDKRCYYMVYIDKIESGRTTTGLESQEKYFDTIITHNRHLIKIEKWILNENIGRYIKMNNIDQPKPDYIYINSEKDKIITLKVKSSKAGIASYSMSVE